MYAVTEDIYTYLSDYLYVNNVAYKYYEKPYYLRMPNANVTNFFVYKIAKLDEQYIKRNLNFQLFFNANVPIADISLNVTYNGQCSAKYKGLISFLTPGSNFKMLKKNNEIFIAFKYTSIYAYIRQPRYPSEVNPYFLDLHLTKIGDVNISDYEEITLTEFN